MNRRANIWAVAIALVGVLAALAAPWAVQIASAKTNHHHYPPGTVKLPSSKIKRVGKTVCGKPGAKWISGTLVAKHEFLSDAQQQRNYKALARRAHGNAKKRDLKRASTFGKRAKAGKGACNPVVTPPGLPPEPAPSIFGIDTGTYDTSMTDFVNDFPTAQGLGARWDRFTLGPGVAAGNYAGIDYEVQQARKHGMGVILSFGCATNIGCPPTSSQDLSSYQAYVERVLARYHTLVDYYESWTEPNHGAEWGGTANPAQYAALLKAQYQAFQSFNAQNGTNMKLLFGSPNSFNLGPSDTNDIAALPFTDQVLTALNGAKAFDGVALHAYRYPPSSGPNEPVSDYVGTLTYPAEGCATATGGYCSMTWSEELESYEQEFLNHGYGAQPMWLTEWGWPGGDTSSFCASYRGYCLTDATQDTYLKDGIADLLALPFVKGALWFNLRDYVPGTPNPDPEYFAHYGLLDYNYTAKAAATDFKALAAANPSR